ncbi:response regulator [Paenibacillus sp. GCM10027626]|uniref:response regulator n=1 Tax=Paenibacillus sp. GCM10027626 TaxID=3273411 RepID=UPI0036398C44
MYKMIIVDDLPLIVESLVKLFAAQQELDVQLYTASSGMEALELMRKHAIDIVLSDIRMPEMDGIELLHQIRQSWPACKVVFLTSYDDFHYAKSAISGGGFEYVLKTEPNEMIVQVVRKAMAALDQEYEIRKKLYRADMQNSRMMPLVIENYFRDQLQRKGADAFTDRHRMFAEWGLPLTDQSLLLLVGRIDAWERWTRADGELMKFAIRNVADECLRKYAQLLSFRYDDSKIVWLLQPSADNGNGGWSSLLEQIQHTCRSLLKVSVTFAITSVPVPWNLLSASFDQLRSLLLSPAGAGKELVLAADAADEKQGEAGSGRVSDYKVQSRNMALLRHYLETGQQAEFEVLFASMTEIGGREPVSGYYKLELYHGLASLFLSYLNIHPLREERASRMNPDKLSSINPDLSWDEMSDYFKELSKSIFAQRAQSSQQHEHEIIGWINDYIARHLSEDLSVSRLAELVQLNQSYLSRLYKGVTGTALSDHIQSARIDKAKQLLKHSSLKIYEIAGEVGYESRLSFIRLFKNQTGMTPQEYRDL